MAKVGRKSKLTKKLISEAERLISAGNYANVTCQYLGIHVSTWCRWLQDAEAGATGLKQEFYEAIKRAEATAEIRNVAIIQRAGQESWQASAWYLERKFHDRWGKKQSHEVTGKDGGAIEIETARNKLIKLLTEEEEEEENTP